MSIKNILMTRDGMTELEAVGLIVDGREEIMESIYSGDYDEAEELFMDYFGLEPDYMMELI